MAHYYIIFLSLAQDALKGTNLRGTNRAQTQVVADFCRFSPFEPFSKKNEAFRKRRFSQKKKKYIYIYMLESYCLYHFFAFWRVRHCTTVFEIPFAAATSKMRARNCTTGEFFLCHLRGYFLPPKSGTVSNFQGGTVSNFHLALSMFPIFGTNWGIFFCEKHPNLGSNSRKRILDARILDPNSWVEFLHFVFSSRRGPQINSLSRNSPPKKSPSIIQPRNGAKQISHCTSVWLISFLAQSFGS